MASPKPGASNPVAYVHVITDLVVLSACETPIVNSFVEPTTRKPPTQHTVEVEEPWPTVALGNAPVVVGASDLVIVDAAVGGTSLDSSKGNGTVSTVSRVGGVSPTGSGVIGTVAKPSGPAIAGAGRVATAMGGLIACLAIFHLF